MHRMPLGFQPSQPSPQEDSGTANQSTSPRNCRLQHLRQQGWSLASNEHGHPHHVPKLTHPQAQSSAAAEWWLTHDVPVQLLLLWENRSRSDRSSKLSELTQVLRQRREISFLSMICAGCEPHVEVWLVIFELAWLIEARQYHYWTGMITRLSLIY